MGLKKRAYMFHVSMMATGPYAVQERLQQLFVWPMTESSFADKARIPGDARAAKMSEQQWTGPWQADGSS